MLTRDLLTLLVPIVACVSGVLTACGSASTTVLSPSPLAERCALELTVAGGSVAAGGGTGTLRVQTNRECSWAIPQQPSWVKVVQPLAAQGPAEITFTVDENRSTSARSWEVVLGNARVVISQASATCSWAFEPAVISVGASGGEVRTSLRTKEFCSWELPRSVSWIAVAPARGQGAAEITLRISPNAGATRKGRVEIAGAFVDVAQREAPPPPRSPGPAPPPPAPEIPSSDPSPAPPPLAPCSFTVSPTSVDVPAAGGSASVSVNSQSDCQWTVSGVPAWLTVSSTSGTGSGSLKIAAASNPGPARNVVLLVAGREVRISQPQSPACMYSVTPRTLTFGRKKGNAKIEVVTSSSCQWRATSSADWISVPSGTRTGSGTIEVKVDEYSTSGTRSGVVIVTGQGLQVEVTVTQGDSSRDDDDDDEDD